MKLPVKRLRLAAACLALLGTLFAQSPPSMSGDFVARLVAAAEARDGLPVRYVTAYVRIPYPGGDVPADTGVCTDEIIRIYRAVGIDLQKEVHEDILAAGSQYPRRSDGRSSDSNIDHRRVPNLIAFFRRHADVLQTSTRTADYAPGDLVTWDLGGGVNHIGIVTDLRAPTGHYMVVHNIGAGPKLEDVLFSWRITGHFRYPAAGSDGR